MPQSLYLDCCALQRPFDDRSQSRVATEAEAALQLIELVEDGRLILLASSPLKMEIAQIRAEIRQEFCQDIIQRFARFVEITDAIAARALEYSEAGIKTMDALHLAHAVEGRADYFCSCDDRFVSRARSVKTELTKVVSLLELMEQLSL